MDLLLLGAPGSGKGSQAELISEETGSVQISTGDLLRQEVAAGTAKGKEAGPFMDKGELVPDHLVSDILSDRIDRSDCSNGIIFDGYPRTVEQAKKLEEILKSKNRRLDAAVNIRVPFDVIIRRLTSRRVCSDCGKGYNLISNPPPEDNKCRSCGGNIIRRDDDKKEVIQKRLDIYLKSTQPLIEYYKEKGILIEVDGEGNVKDIYQDLRKRLKETTGM